MLSEIDNLDKKILYHFLKNSRNKFSEIAKENSISVTTVKTRFDKMIESGIIKRPTLIINAKKIGYEGYASIYVNVIKDQLDDFINYIKNQFSLVPFKIELNEKFNTHILFPFFSMSEVQEKKEKIRQHNSVIDLKVNIWTEIIFLPENLSALRL